LLRCVEGVQRAGWGLDTQLNTVSASINVTASGKNVDVVDKQLYIFSEIKKKGLSVRQTEDLVRKLYTGNTPKPTIKSSMPDAYKKIEDKISSEYGTKVKLTHNKKGYGTIQFDYYSLEELNGLLEKLKINVS
jgi:ParB family chromosome partitioning protein